MRVECKPRVYQQALDKSTQLGLPDEFGEVKDFVESQQRLGRAREVKGGLHISALSLGEVTHRKDTPLFITRMRIAFTTIFLAKEKHQF